MICQCHRYNSCALCKTKIRLHTKLNGFRGTSEKNVKHIAIQLLKSLQFTGSFFQDLFLFCLKILSAFEKKILVTDFANIEKRWRVNNLYEFIAS